MYSRNEMPQQQHGNHDHRQQQTIAYPKLQKDAPQPEVCAIANAFGIGSPKERNTSLVRTEPREQKQKAR